MDQQLKPCPFCGGENIEVVCVNGWWRVVCGGWNSTGCGASTQHAGNEHEEQARNAWNRRHNAGVHLMSTEHSPAAPAVAHTPSPWTVGDSGAYKVVEARGVRIATLPFQFAVEESEANAALICAAPDLLAALEKIAAAEGPYSVDRLTHAENTIDSMVATAQAALARARGLRPCDDPALVPEVLQAQPQCVHGESTSKRPDVSFCPIHSGYISIERHENISTGGRWYTYVCDGFLEEAERESGE